MGTKQIETLRTQVERFGENYVIYLLQRDVIALLLLLPTYCKGRVVTPELTKALASCIVRMYEMSICLDDGLLESYIESKIKRIGDLLDLTSA